MAALAECGTHAIVAAEIGRDGEGEETLRLMQKSP
jgi:hypothetical protein